MAFAMDRQGAHAHTFPNTRLLDEAELLSAVQVLCLWHVLFLHDGQEVWKPTSASMQQRYRPMFTVPLHAMRYDWQVSTML